MMPAKNNKTRARPYANFSTGHPGALRREYALHNAAALMESRKLLLLEPGEAGPGLRRGLAEHGWEAHATASNEMARHMADQGNYLVGIVSLDTGATWSNRDIERLTAIHAMHWIAVVAAGSLADAGRTRLLLDSFFDHHTQPVDTARLATVLGHAYGRALMRQRAQHRGATGRFSMIGKSRPMLDLYDKLERVVRADAPVLITGETGTGKELVAQAIHRDSPRASGPFVPINCGALAPHLMHSELFGHEKGAFSGAGEAKIGRLESAAGGTLFLDQIGDLPLDLQGGLLRVLEDKTLVRLGGSERVGVDVRVIAATHADLQTAVAQGRFRQDLYYRLNVVHVAVPALRERQADIELLAQAVFNAFSAQKNPAVRGLSQESLEAMRQHDWPGNMRELVSRVQRAMIMSRQRLISARDLGLAGDDDPASASDGSVRDRASGGGERGLLQLTLRNNDNDVTRAANALGVSQGTLQRLMEKLRIPASPR